MHQSFHQALVCQGVHFQNDAALLALVCRLCRLFGQLNQILLQMEWRKHELVKPRDLALICQQIKNSLYILGDLGVAGQVAYVGIEFRCFRVVVAGRKMRIAADHSAFAARYQQHLGMCF